MPLPSQTTAPVRSRSHMYRRKRPRRKPVLAIVVVACAVLVIAWQFVPWPGEAGEIQPGDDAYTPSDGSVALNDADLDDGTTPPIIDPALDGTAPGRGEQAPAAHQEIVMGSGTTSKPGSVDTAAASSSEAGVAPADADGTAGRTVLPSITPTEVPQPSPGASEFPGAGAGAGDRNEQNRGPASTASLRVQQLLTNGWDFLRANRLVEARRTLSRALESNLLSDAQSDQVRQALTDISESLVFSPLVMEGDQFARDYAIQGGDLLSGIVRRFGLQVDWRFIQRINNIANPARIRAGQRIKLITGPFHAVVHKSAYRLDLFLGEDEDRVFVRSFPVGLGEYNKTPVGLFRVRQDSKLINPQWRNPNTGDLYKPDDPRNPIGERWLGLEGIDEQTRSLDGYGIHGTIEPDSIGRQASMGCIRMRAEDVEIVYEVLVEGVSTVRIAAD